MFRQAQHDNTQGDALIVVISSGSRKGVSFKIQKTQRIMLIKNIRVFILEPAQIKKTNLRITGSVITAEGSSLKPKKNEKMVTPLLL